MADAEALQIVYDPDKVSYRTLLEFFYKMHDPTTANRQGPDVGSQYRSGVFYHNDEQEKVARDVTNKVNRQWWKGGIVTEILPAGQWWDAETYHQLYLDKSQSARRQEHKQWLTKYRSGWVRMPVAFPAQFPSALLG